MYSEKNGRRPNSPWVYLKMFIMMLLQVIATVNSMVCSYTYFSLLKIFHSFNSARDIFEVFKYLNCCFFSYLWKDLLESKLSSKIFSGSSISCLLSSLVSSYSSRRGLAVYDL